MQGWFFTGTHRSGCLAAGTGHRCNGRVVLIGVGAIEFSVVMILACNTGRRGARQDPDS